MRPTLLDFKSPKEKTPDYLDQTVTYTGQNLNFQARTLNKKGSVLPQAERFQQYQLFKGGSSASSYLGPGTYNDHNSFLKLNKIPCASIMVIISAI